MCDCDDGGRSVFHREDEVRGAKGHACIECKETIPKGTQHIYFAGKWERDVYDSYFYSGRICLQCRDDWSILSGVTYEARGETCVCYGELQEEVGNAFTEGDFELYLESDSAQLDEQTKKVRALLERWFPSALEKDEEDLEDPPSSPAATS